jgi:hypothetical protein
MYIRDSKIEREHASESLRVLSVNSDISGFREIVILTLYGFPRCFPSSFFLSYLFIAF